MFFKLYTFSDKYNIKQVNIISCQNECIFTSLVLKKAGKAQRDQHSHIDLTCPSMSESVKVLNALRATNYLYAGPISAHTVWAGGLHMTAHFLM